MCAQITTGFQIDTNDQSAVLNKNSKEPLRVVIVGNFSGSGRVQNSATEKVKPLKTVKLDKDNFDDVFEKMDVTLCTELSDTPIRFRNLDDIHPDEMFEKIPVFSVFNFALNKIKKCKTYDEGVAVLNKAGVNIISAVSADEVEESSARIKDGGSIISLDEVLSSTNYEKHKTIQEVISEIVKPFAEIKPDARLEDLRELLLDAIGQSMRALLNSADYKNLEALWRSVDFVNRRLDTDKAIDLQLLDISLYQLKQQLSGENYQNSEFYHILSRSKSMLSDKPFDIVVLADSVMSSDNNVEMLHVLTEVAKEVNFSLFMDFDLRVIGCDSLIEFPQAQDWMGQEQLIKSERYQSWNDALHKFQNLYLFAPRVLMRMPYGEKTSPLESFKFEELLLDSQNDLWRLGFCWGSAAVVALIVAERHHLSNLKSIEKRIDQLPFFAVDYKGEVLVQPPTEVALNDRSVRYLSDLNVNCFLGAKDQNCITLCSFIPSS